MTLLECHLDLSLSASTVMIALQWKEEEDHVDYDLVPGFLYTHSEVASVGKTDEQTKSIGVAYRIDQFPLMENSWVKAIDDAKGIMKIIIEMEIDKILGVHIIL